jgi:hypothetical protein
MNADPRQPEVNADQARFEISNLKFQIKHLLSALSDPRLSALISGKIPLRPLRPSTVKVKGAARRSASISVISVNQR